MHLSLSVLYLSQCVGAVDTSAKFKAAETLVALALTRLEPPSRHDHDEPAEGKEYGAHQLEAEKGSAASGAAQRIEGAVHEDKGEGGGGGGGGRERTHTDNEALR